MYQESWLIVCEGKETEPNYFQGLMELANSRANRPVEFKIVGTGLNTKSLVRAADNLFQWDDEDQPGESLGYDRVFTVFDRDSFPPGQFNRAIEISEKKGFTPLWSNECIELWFLLHFQFLESNIPREQYMSALSKKFRKELGTSYNKSRKDIFQLLYTPERLKYAVAGAKKLYLGSSEEHSPSKRCPCTTVYQFIELLEYELDADLQEIADEEDML